MLFLVDRRATCQKKSYLYFQVYEMFIAGWTFHVLSPIFAIHWGFQNKKSRPSWRERQNNHNR